MSSVYPGCEFCFSLFYSFFFSIAVPISHMIFTRWADLDPSLSQVSVRKRNVLPLFSSLPSRLSLSYKLTAISTVGVKLHVIGIL